MIFRSWGCHSWSHLVDGSSYFVGQSPSKFIWGE